MPRTADIARALAAQGVEVEYVKWPPEREDGRLFTPAPEQIPGQVGFAGFDRMERMRLGAERARAQRKTDAWSRALAETADMPCRCGLEHHSPETLRELGAGCTAPRYVCPRLDALRRRFGQ